MYVDGRLIRDHANDRDRGGLEVLMETRSINLDKDQLSFEKLQMNSPT